MKRLIICLSLVFIGQHLYCQYDHCDRLTINGHQSLFEAKGVDNTKDFIEKFFPEQSNYYSNRRQLKAIDLFLNRDSSMVFTNDKSKIEMNFAKKIL